MYGMTIREQRATLASPPLLDRLAAGADLDLPGDVPDLHGYVELALRSGFPEPSLSLSDRARARWLDSYVEQLVTRDAIGLEPGRDPVRLRRYLEAYALNSAGIVSEETLLDAVGINRKTANAYERLLANLFIADSLPAWTSNRLRRLARRPKRYLIDSALTAAVLRLDADAVLRDGDILGRILDTFVLSQLRAELAVTDSRPRLYHLREEHGRHEIDTLAELAGQTVIAFEVKAAAAPRRDDARHLIWMRDRIGTRFVRGIVFHTGPSAFQLDDKITALPVRALL
jgi:predicted AAA+ superfamily ATPase